RHDPGGNPAGRHGRLCAGGSACGRVHHGTIERSGGEGQGCSPGPAAPGGGPDQVIAKATSLLCLATVPLAAQTGTPPRPALPDLPASVRSAGMAGIAVPLPGDAAVVFVNPSSIGPLRRLSVEASY